MGEFAKVAAAIEPEWEKRIAEQSGRLHKVIPSSSEEATAKALKSLLEMKQQAHSLGYTLRSMSQQQGLADLMKEMEPTHTPGREMLIDLPALKEAGLGSMLQSAVGPIASGSAAQSVARGMQKHTPTFFKAMGAPARVAHSALQRAPQMMPTGTPASIRELPIMASKQVSPFDPKSSVYGGKRRAATVTESAVTPEEMAMLGIKSGEVLPDWVEDKMWSKEAGIFGALTEPIRYGAQDVKAELARMADERFQEATTPTSEPKTLPWYYPAMAATVPTAFTSGYRQADTDADAAVKAQMAEKVEAARQDFEKALEHEYRLSRQRKEAAAPVATPGELIDGLAQIHLIKESAGELNTAAGMYLALATLLGMGSYQVGKNWAEKNDPRYQRVKAMKDVIRQRMRSRPLPVLVSSEPLDAPDPVEPTELPKTAAAEDEAPGIDKERLAGGALLAAGAPVTALGIGARPMVQSAEPMQTAKHLAQAAEGTGGANAREMLKMIGPHYIRGAHEALKGKPLGVETRHYMNALNRVMDALHAHEFKDPGHYKFVQQHYDAFKESPRKGMEMAINEAHQFKNVPPHAQDMLREFDEIAARSGEDQALKQVFANPKYKDIAFRVGLNKAKWAVLYGRALNTLKAAPYVGGAAVLGGAGLLAHNLLKGKKPEHAG
jgi:hypothetical protein